MTAVLITWLKWDCVVMRGINKCKLILIWCPFAVSTLAKKTVLLHSECNLILWQVFLVVSDDWDSHFIDALRSRDFTSIDFVWLKKTYNEIEKGKIRIYCTKLELQSNWLLLVHFINKWKQFCDPLFSRELSITWCLRIKKFLVLCSDVFTSQHSNEMLFPAFAVAIGGTKYKVRREKTNQSKN